MIVHARERPRPLRGLLRATPIIGVYLALDVLFVLALPDRAWQIRPDHLIVIGVLGLWRYSWMLLHIVRALIYQVVTFPRIRRRADALPDDQAYPDRLYFLIPTFKEQPWITQHMLHAVLREVAPLPCKTTLLVTNAGGAEDDLFLKILEKHPLGGRVEMVLLRQQHGKRIGMGHTLRALSRRHSNEESLVVFMDGDTVLGPGVLQKCLPLFKLYPRLGAATSDELALVEGSRWYRLWYELRFSQRHRMMKSHSLSRRVLTLTGRFSVFRTELTISEEFIRYLENDSLEHWLFGRFRFLTGDDKSTWYHMLRDGWEMLYVPDALVYSMESSGDRPLRQSLAKMHRWFGNMLRNNGRAIRLGPKPMGGFIWWCLVDQRLSMWTTLVGPVGAILLAVFVSPFYLAFYLFGAVLARLVYLTLLAVEGHRMSFVHLPQLIYSQWVASLVKIWVVFRLDRQSWGAARGGMTVEARSGAPPWLRRSMPAFQTTLFSVVFLGFVALMVGVLELPTWPPAAWASETESRQVFLPGTASPGILVEATDFGAVPDDDEPDDAAIRQALESLPQAGLAAVQLPPGLLLLDGPVVVRRSNTWLIGSGRDATRLEARFDRKAGEAVIELQGEGRRRSRASRLRTDLPLGVDMVELEPGHELSSGDFVWLGAPNSRDFLDLLGSEVWDREYPWLRQSIFQVLAVEGTHLLLDRPSVLELPAAARAEPVRMLAGVRLHGFTMRHRVPGGRPEEADQRYENLHPRFAVDALRLDWVADSEISDLRIEMAGRHPLNVENSLRVRIREIEIDGAWNKGVSGAGYVRFSRSHKCRLQRSSIRSIRHLTFQWSASENLVEGSFLGVDVNFHGGFSHNNRVIRSRIEPPSGHPWPPVVTTPPDAAWAPPDGPSNRVVFDGTG